MVAFVVWVTPIASVVGVNERHVNAVDGFGFYWAVLVGVPGLSALVFKLWLSLSSVAFPACPSGVGCGTGVG